jgi:acyl-homoserine lactone acylase PvdQ
LSRVRLLAAAVVLAAALSAPAADAAVEPYGTNDAGGFRNVLPPGSKGTDNALELATFTATGTRPAHWDDQQPLYENLLYASPTLTHDQIADYFKDATFGVRDGDVDRMYSPRPGVTVVRDKSYGVPHVYGDTRGDVAFGAGYVGAEDRLFLMDVLRHTGRATLSSFVGGTPGNREMDRTQWALAPYTEEDLQKQIDLAPQLYGDTGRQMVADLDAYVDGINAYIAAARANPMLLPGEYAAFGQSVQDWKPTDVIATASLIGGIFGKGGGKELRSALALQAFEDRFGVKKGRRAWSDFRSKNDPEAPTTVLGKRFPYETRSPFSKRGLALPDRGSVQFTPVAEPVSRAAVKADQRSFGKALLTSAANPPHASNWEIVSKQWSATGHAIGVLGPQVGYYVPQILMEEDLHGPGFDARGAAFPGVNLVVQLGHGRDYAWSATTADTDNVDTFAEVLCQDDVHYLYNGECRPMEKLERTNSYGPSVGAQDSPTGSETLTAYRTVHGIVYARGTVKGRKVAYALARTTYFHEADSAIGFFCLNDPNCVKDPESFRRAAGAINFGFNWGYVDADHTAYQQSGWYPKRAKGTSPDFPVLGTGEYDWQGYDPALHTQKVLSNAQRPHAVDQPYTVSWNGKQAKGWAAADDVYFWGSLQRQQMIQAPLKRSIALGQKITVEQLVQSMEEPATQDIRGLYDVPVAVRAMGKVTDPELQAAIATLTAWSKTGAHRRDLDKDGVYDDDAAVTLMDAWWPKLAEAVFAPALGGKTVDALRSMVPYDAELAAGGDESPSAPAFSTGWYGFVHKDLRTLTRPKTVKGRWSRVYCGGGKRKACAKALQASLKSALTVSKADLYGRGPCAENAQASCFDMNRSTIASAVSVPPFPFQNRPTFQQVVQVTQTLPR